MVVVLLFTNYILVFLIKLLLCRPGEERGSWQCATEICTGAWNSNIVFIIVFTWIRGPVDITSRVHWWRIFYCILRSGLQWVYLQSNFLKIIRLYKAIHAKLRIHCYPKCKESWNTDNIYLRNCMCNRIGTYLSTLACLVPWKIRTKSYGSTSLVAAV